MFNDFSKHGAQSKLSTLYTALIEASNQAFSVKNGNIPKWETAIHALEQYTKGSLDFQSPYLYIDTHINQTTLTLALKKLMPWRKGPYQIGDLKLDSEWRGDLKWHRIKNHIQPLKGRTVLDVGAGNGYFTYLMALEGADTALGIEPFLLFNYQFQAIKSLISHPPNAFLLPLKLEQIPSQPVFDTVFSMGVLYHQKDHLLHLQQLKNVLTKDGELILETLIIDKKWGDCLIPPDRYAKMRNVWCLPSTDTLKIWLKQTGFRDIKLIDVSKTTPHEQRATHWIGDNTQSLKDFLDPHDHTLTIEGLPAPQRAVFICRQ